MKTLPHFFPSLHRSVALSAAIVAAVLLAPFAPTVRADMPMAMPQAAPSDPALAKQLSDLQAQLAALQAQMAGHDQHPGNATMAPTTSAPAMAMPATPANAMPNMGSAPASGMGGMMKDKMDAMKAPMGGGSSGGGGMGMMSNMEAMMGMMGGMGGGSMAMPSDLPGFPGASHLYHIGATGFFLDHPEHIALTTDQQKALNQLKEKALLEQSATDRKIEGAEQELWTLTASDQPDAAKIQAKLAEIEKLRSDKRFAFIKAVGEAAKMLTEQQRQALLGNSPMQPATPAQPAMPPMKGM